MSGAAARTGSLKNVIIIKYIKKKNCLRSIKKVRRTKDKRQTKKIWYS